MDIPFFPQDSGDLLWDPDLHGIFFHIYELNASHIVQHEMDVGIVVSSMKHWSENPYF